MYNCYFHASTSLSRAGLTYRVASEPLHACMGHGHTKSATGPRHSCARSGARCQKEPAATAAAEDMYKHAR
eukprot:366573-Chlamydomonas_euryale.AAC.8